MVSTSGKYCFNIQETHHLNIGIRLAKTSHEVHVGWKGNQLMATTITDTWVGARELFGGTIEEGYTHDGSGYLE